MAKSFADLWASLNLNTTDFNSKLKASEKRVNRFAKHMLGLTQETDDLFDPKKKGAFKDPSRIIQGIVVAKAFYSTMNAIRKCKDAVWEFSQELEYAHMAYSNLFGDTALAEEFINVLEDFAARTPFSFKQSEAAAKRLLAYGIEYKNVMYVMQGVLAASAAQKDPHVIEAVSRALGQIYTKGRLMNEEMRQLAEAGIPAYEILREKLGLTQKQLQNLGKQAIPASKAINALIEGMNERFGSVVKESVNTVPGLISNIKDNLLMTTSGLFDPLYNQIRELLKKINKAAQSIREAFARGGSGAVLEKIFPKWMHQDIRMFAAAFGNLAMAVHRLVRALHSMLKPAILAIIRVFNVLAPLLTVVSNVLSAIVRVIMSNEVVLRSLSSALAVAATMWVLFKAKAVACKVIGYIVKGIDYAVKGLILTLTFLHAHPIWGMLMLAGGLLIGLSGGFGKVSEAVTFLHRKLMALSGIDPDKIFLPSQKDRADDLDKFNQALDGTKDTMDELGDSTGKTAKAAKNLLSFDEVFRLKEPDEGTEGGIQVPDLGDFPDLDMEGMMPEDGAFGGFAEDFFTKLIESMKTKVLSSGLGAALGGIIGWAFTKTATGTKIGAAIGTFAGLFWDMLADKLKVSSMGRFTIPAATGLGLAIGKLVKHPLIGLAIGGFVSWVSEAIGQGLETNDWSGTIAPACTAIGAAIGHFVPVIGPVIGAAIGAVVGFLVDAIVDNWDTVKSIGAALWNGFTGWLSRVGNWLKGVPSRALTMFKDFCGGLNWLADQVMGFFGRIGDAVSSGLSRIGGWLKGVPERALAQLKDFCAGLNWLADQVMGFFGKIGDTIVGWASSAWESVSTWFSNGITYLSNGFTSIVNTVTMWLTNLSMAVQMWWQTAWLNITTTLTNLWTMFITFVTTVWTTVTTWITTAWTSVTTWATTIWTMFSEWLTNLWTSFTDWVVEMWDSLTTWLTDMWDSITSWATSMWDSFVGWLSRLWTGITTWFVNAWSVVSTWLTTTWTNIVNWFTNMWNTISTWLANLRNTLSTWLGNIWSSVSAWFSRIIGGIGAWFGNILGATVRGLSNIWSHIMNWFSNLFSAVWRKLTEFANMVSEWWNNLWAGKTSFFNFGGSSGSHHRRSRSSGDDDRKPRTAPRPSPPFGGSGGFAGHASGGVFNREHLARFAEGNKAEAIIPLENESAMRPFVDAVANGLTATLAPMLAVSAGPQQPQMPPMYVGTLIADERSLRELERKMQVIRIQETKRRG